MNIDGLPYRTIWPAEEGVAVEIIDQTRLPHEFATVRLENLHDAAIAIKNMLVRGAPLIGATAAYGVALAMSDKASDTALEEACATLAATRPTAINLRWALARMQTLLLPLPPEQRAQAAWLEAAAICDEDVDNNRALGEHGLQLIRDKLEAKGDPVNILTHCNAGWLATVDWGTALAPIYTAFDAGIPLHVWVDETRPRNQGASLTAWELQQHGVPHTVIADNTGGHLMQHGMVDMVIVGTDRTTACGDVCNKIGTYLKALAAFDNQIPFYVALPGPTIDWTLEDGVREIPIEQRDAEEVTQIRGRTAEGEIVSVTLTPHGSPAANYAFDVTPARLVTGLITERGVCPASREGLLGLYPEHSSASLTAREAESRTVSEAELRRALIDTAIAAQHEGLNRGASGNLSVRCGEGFLVTPSGMAPGEQTARGCGVDGFRRQCARQPQAFERVAFPPRSLRCKAGIRCRAACPFHLRHHPGLPGPRHSALSLHDRGSRWQNHPLRALRHFRHTGTLGTCSGRHHRPKGLPARQSRPAGSRKLSGTRPGAGRGSGKPVRAVLPPAADRHAQPAFRHRNGCGAGEIQKLWAERPDG